MIGGQLGSQRQLVEIAGDPPLADPVGIDERLRTQQRRGHGIRTVDTRETQRDETVGTEARQGVRDRVGALGHPEHEKAAERREHTVIACDRTQQGLAYAAPQGVIRLFSPQPPQRFGAVIGRVQIGGERGDMSGIGDGRKGV
ncbi:hypothetical protein GCM10007198_11100 [Microbacterium aerolatum]|uniref:Uncharacterized protein n=1 Tax=Microbacterium aerolatum TaxID=153731 RepID=A0A511AG67_9MICO|nr:hypothetical protein MAE01_15590 [Microbacterium aerolatum]GGB22454.1 hypothetical protein GCM10007198_11100 [Microbacterium aerolatum]